MLLILPKVVPRADLCTWLSPSCHSCCDRAPGCPAAPEPLLPFVGPVGFPSAHQIVRVGVGMGGNLWENCVASPTKDMAPRAPLHTCRSPFALLVLPGSCAGAEGWEWEAGVRLWGDVAMWVSLTANTSPSAADSCCPGSADRLVLRGTTVLEQTPCTPSLHSRSRGNSECT